MSTKFENGNENIYSSSQKCTVLPSKHKEKLSFKTYHYIFHLLHFFRSFFSHAPMSFSAAFSRFLYALLAPLLSVRTSSQNYLSSNSNLQTNTKKQTVRRSCTYLKTLKILKFCSRATSAKFGKIRNVRMLWLVGRL